MLYVLIIIHQKTCFVSPPPNLNSKSNMSITSKSYRNFTFGQSQTPDNVGPGMYNPNYKHNRYHAPIPFGSTTRRELFPTKEDESNIAPGMYDPVLQPRITRSSLCSIGKSSDRKYFVDNSNSPGPANYSQLSDWTKGVHKAPKTAIPEMVDSRVPFDITPLTNGMPGPGAYNAQSFTESDKGVSFSQSRAPQREPVYDNGIPGPGAYNIKRNEIKNPSKPSPAFRGSTEERDIFDTKHALDGYFLEHKAWPAEEPTKRPFGGLVKRELQFIKKDGVPGPAKYSLPDPFKPKIVSKRSDFGVDRDPYKGYPNNYPGPGFYETTKETPKGVVIPKQGRTSLWNIQKGPSPAQYTVNEMDIIETKEKRRIANPAFKSSSKRDAWITKEPGPGPADYPRMPSESKNGFKFSKAKRFKSYDNGVPGPNSYEMPKEKKPAHQIGRSSVFKDRIDNTPGPGAYGVVQCEMYHPSYNVKLDDK